MPLNRAALCNNVSTMFIEVLIMYRHIPLGSERDVAQYLQIKGECHSVLF